MTYRLVKGSELTDTEIDDNFKEAAKVLGGQVSPINAQDFTDILADGSCLVLIPLRTDISTLPKTSGQYVLSQISAPTFTTGKFGGAVTGNFHLQVSNEPATVIKAISYWIANSWTAWNAAAYCLTADNGGQMGWDGSIFKIWYADNTTVTFGSSTTTAIKALALNTFHNFVIQSVPNTNGECDLYVNNTYFGRSTAANGPKDLSFLYVHMGNGNDTISKACQIRFFSRTLTADDLTKVYTEMGTSTPTPTKLDMSATPIISGGVITNYSSSNTYLLSPPQKPPSYPSVSGATGTLFSIEPNKRMSTGVVL